MLSWFLILLLAHLITDFVLQTNSLVEKKRNKIAKVKHLALSIHSAEFLAISLILFFSVYGPGGNKFMTGILFVTAGHYLLDWIKCGAQKKYPEFRLFVIDQFFHLFLIVIVTLYYQKHICAITTSTLQNYLMSDLMADFGLLPKVLLILCLLIIITTFANIFIRMALFSIKTKFVQDTELIKIGRYIGIVERILTVIGVIAGSYEALAALYASKTAIRFGQAREDPRFGEYYILGTSISALFGITAGVLIKWVLGI